MRSLWSTIININAVEFLILQVYTKLQKCGEYVLLAACDEELLGKTLKDGKLVFNIREEFYKGPRIAVEEAIELIQESSIVNMVGQNIVTMAIEKGLVHPEAVLKICGIPHAQIVRI
jgi:hypothetical protein